MKRHRRVASILAGIVAFVVSPAGAQVTVDLAKITCDQYLTFKVADPQSVSIWLSGYFNGQRSITVLEPQRFKENFDRLKSACFLRANANRPVLQVAQEMLTGKK